MPPINIVVTVEWMKDGPEGDIITSRLEQVDLGTDADGEPVNSCLIMPAERRHRTGNAETKDQGRPKGSAGPAAKSD